MGTYSSDQRNAKFYGLKLSRNTDAKMIRWLDQKESVQGYLKSIIKEDMKREEKHMTRSEAIETYRSQISEAMIERYRKVLESAGRIQYKVYVWEDGEIECLSGPQGDHSRLEAKDSETRALYYVSTVAWLYNDEIDSEAVEDLMDEYEASLPDELDTIIREAEDDEI